MGLFTRSSKDIHVPGIEHKPTILALQAAAKRHKGKRGEGLMVGQTTSARVESRFHHGGVEVTSSRRNGQAELLYTLSSDGRTTTHTTQRVMHPTLLQRMRGAQPVVVTETVAQHRVVRDVPSTVGKVILRQRPSQPRLESQTTHSGNGDTSAWTEEWRRRGWNHRAARAVTQGVRDFSQAYRAGR